jgi:S1-C subfamily serine protease
MTVRREEGDENEDFFPALGFGLKKENDGVFVTETLPHASEEIAKGDRVTSLNGTAVGNVADFNKALDAVMVGEEMMIELVRDGKARSVSMKRPQPRQMRMMR